jgi:hypothetical protein
VPCLWPFRLVVEDIVCFAGAMWRAWTVDPDMGTDWIAKEGIHRLSKLGRQALEEISRQHR